MSTENSGQHTFNVDLRRLVMKVLTLFNSVFVFTKKHCTGMHVHCSVINQIKFEF